MDNSQIPSTPLFPPGQPCPDYGCPVPGCPVPDRPLPPCPPPPPKPPYPDPHDPGYWASDGDWPLPPEDHGRPPVKRPPEKTCPPTVVPPPIPPVRYVPGMDVQEQLVNMSNHVNVCIDRWNQIQANCFEALDKVVGAAVSNDVYYEPDEVRFSTGYSSADGANYEIIESRPVDKSGRPIFMRLMTAYNSGNYAVREPLLQKSFVSSANAIVTGVSPATTWRGLCLVGGNPQPTNEPQDGDWLCGWTKRGVLRLLPATEFTVEMACRNQIVDCIGPVIPIVMNGKPTEVAADFPADPGAIQAIGWKQCNGNKVMFSCGYQDDAGCTVKNVADLLVSMGVTTAAITCYMNKYGAGNMGPFVKQTDTEAAPLSSDASVANVIGQTQHVYDGTVNEAVLGLTGGMAYIGKLADRPINYQLPANAAYWVITKRPIKAGWPNRWTGEIADICQRLGSTSTELDAVHGKLDVEQAQILDLQKRVGDLEENDKTQDDLLKEHGTRITNLENRMDMAEQDIQKLQQDLATETQNRIDADNVLQQHIDDEAQERKDADAAEAALRAQEDADIREQLQKEVDNRIDGDNKLSDRVNQLRTALTDEITARNQADQDLSNAILNEVNARIAGDTQLSTKIDLTQMNLENKILNEQTKREQKDDDLQNQIDELQKDVNELDIQPGRGLRATKDGTGTKTFDVYAGPGLRFNSLGQLVPNTGPGIMVENGLIKPKLSDCFCINEEGEISMNCCDNKLPIAGDGVDYGVNAQTGEVILNVVPPANGQIGGVKAGQGITISDDGTISANGGESYTLPAATKTTLGGVIVGDNITVDETGKISASSDYTLPVASATDLGGVRVGKNLVIDANGVLNAELPENPGGEGETVLAGEGINVIKDATLNTATVGLNATTQGTLSQVGDNKDAIDALSTRVTNLSNNSVSNTTFQNTVQDIQSSISAVNGKATSAQTSADNALQAAADAADKADEASAKADGALQTSGGTMTGNITFANNTGRAGVVSTVTGLPEPSADSDAANKKYVDDAVAAGGGGGGGDYLPLAGGTMTGNIDMGGNSINNTNTLTVGSGDTALITGAGVSFKASDNDDLDALVVTRNIDPTTGSTMSLTVGKTMLGNTGSIIIRGVATPTDNADAANKKYVDDAVAAGGGGSGGPYLPLAGGGTVTSSSDPNNTTSIDGYQIKIASTNASSTTLESHIGPNFIQFRTTGTDDNAISFYKSTGIINITPITVANSSNDHVLLRNIATPISASDAATKEYVDAVAAGTTPGTYLPLSGGTMTGNLKIGSSNPSTTITQNSTTISSPWNDNIALIVNDTGATNQRGFQASIALESSSFGSRTPVIIRGIKNPVEQYDAANKAYVDSVAGGGWVECSGVQITNNGNPVLSSNDGNPLFYCCYNASLRTYMFIGNFKKVTKTNGDILAYRIITSTLPGMNNITSSPQVLGISSNGIISVRYEVHNSTNIIFTVEDNIPETSAVTPVAAFLRILPAVA